MVAAVALESHSARYPIFFFRTSPERGILSLRARETCSFLPDPSVSSQPQLPAHLASRVVLYVCWWPLPRFSRPPHTRHHTIVQRRALACPHGRYPPCGDTLASRTQKKKKSARESGVAKSQKVHRTPAFANRSPRFVTARWPDGRGSRGLGLA